VRKLACRALAPLAIVMLSVPAASAAEGKVVKGSARAADGVAIAYEARGKGDVALVFIHG
jgi:hypothetical protein